jgi:amidohydrolase
MVATTRLENDIDELMPGIIADRRHLHENPELGFHEHETARFVAERLRALGVEDIRTGINQTGITALVKGQQGPGRVVLVRADMDALPIHEENDVEYKSQNDGVMHACGHDAHTAILLAVTRLLMERRDQFKGTVKVLFQPAEEIFPGGANGMIREGVLEAPHVDAVLGLHMSQSDPLGEIHVAAGPVMAAADSFRIKIQGKGGHGAAPHECVDPILIGTQIVSALQSLVARETDPLEQAVVSVCAFHAGEAFNVIADTAELRGTVRTFTAELRDQMETRLTALAQNVAIAMRGEATVEYQRGYPASINDEGMVEIVREAAKQVVGEEKVITSKPQMGAEDFSYFLLERPGAFFFVGSKNEERGLVWGHHHPRFDIDEESMANGVGTMLTSILAYLNQ